MNGIDGNYLRHLMSAGFNATRRAAVLADAYREQRVCVVFQNLKVFLLTSCNLPARICDCYQGGWTTGNSVHAKFADTAVRQHDLS